MKFTIYEIWTRARIVEAENDAAAYDLVNPDPVEGMNLSNWHVVRHDPRDADESPIKMPILITPVKSLLLMAFLLWLPLSASAQSLKIPATAFIAANTADVVTTYAALHSGHGREGNPIVRGPQLIAVKALSTAGVIGVSQVLAKRGHRKASVITLWTLTGVLGSIAAHNAQIARSR